jgi:hypothetical protein
MSGQIVKRMVLWLVTALIAIAFFYAACTMTQTTH